MIIADINAKGGVGKTTTSIYLGCAFHEMGHPVTVIDLDPQGSASEWCDYAEENGTPLPFEVKDTNAHRFPSTVRDADNRAADAVTIIDTPPGDAALMDLAAKAADFVVVPTGASGMDLAQVWKILDPLAGTAHAVLLTGTRQRTRNLADVREALTQSETAVFGTEIPEREAIKRAFGSCPSELMGYEDVATEIKEALK